MKMNKNPLKVFLFIITFCLTFATAKTYAEGDSGLVSGSGYSGAGSGSGYTWSVMTGSEAQSQLSSQNIQVAEGVANVINSTDSNENVFVFTDGAGNIVNPDNAVAQLGKDTSNFDPNAPFLENGMSLNEALKELTDKGIDIEGLGAINADQLSQLLQAYEDSGKVQVVKEDCGCSISCPNQTENSSASNSASGSVSILGDCGPGGICETPDVARAEFLHVYQFHPGCVGGACSGGSVNPPVIYEVKRLDLGEGYTSHQCAHYQPTANFMRVLYGVPSCTPIYRTETYPCNCTESCDDDGSCTTTCDTCVRQVCAGCSCSCSYTPGSWNWTGDSGNAEVCTDAYAKNPYNYKNVANVDEPKTKQVYTGEKTEVGGKITNQTQIGSGGKHTHTFSNKKTRIQLIEFTVAPEKSPDVGGSESSSSDPCTHFKNKMGVGDNIIWDCNAVIDEEKLLAPGASAEYHNITRSIPDNKPNGTKYCWAIGAFTSDSGGSGMGNPPTGTWVISGASCTTISKKPNFQVWNSGLYTGGSVSTSLSPKVPGSGFGNYSSDIKTFGSWEEQLAIIGGSTSGFASGNAIGYNNYGFALPGGKEGSVGTGDISPLTISNTGSTIGNSGIRTETTAAALIARLKARYPANSETSNIPTTVLQANGEVKVFRSHGDININGDVCYGPCNIDHAAPQQTLTLNQQNLSTDAISSLPQVIIISENGNVNISSNVERIDAWIIAENGTINTCRELTNNQIEAGYNNGVSGGRDTKNCNRQLIVNGPVIAKGLALNRTAGANATYNNGAIASRYGGDVAQEGGDVRNQNLANDGSITPAEIFNLRPDTYLWAYSQAQEFTEAVVTYSRELAPRL